uniref:Putative ixodegrin protein n=1 Tax=Ixodes ricinus TaxID=34613 RepID=A0A0K8RCK0_IXORI
MKTFCLALALTVIVAALLEDVTAYFEGQVPVLPPGAVTRPPGDLGQWCNAADKCKNGTCCLRSRFGFSATCRPLGQRGEACSESPTKGDIFVGHCPCSPELRCRHISDKIHICVSGK